MNVTKQKESTTAATLAKQAADRARYSQDVLFRAISHSFSLLLLKAFDFIVCKYTYNI